MVQGEKLPPLFLTFSAYELINQILKYIELIGNNSYVKSQSVDVI